MKRLAFILLSIVLFTACDNESIDPAIDLENPTPNPDPNPGEGSESDDLALLLYELDTEINISFFGIPLQTITNSDLNVEDDKLVSGTNALSVEGSPFVVETQVITRNQNGQVINDKSVNMSNVTTNEYVITYSNGNIESITYDYFEDDIDDYFYTFTYNGNSIIRTDEGTTITTVFTLDSTGRVIQKETFDDGFSIQNEVVSYGPTGNIESSQISGELNQNVTYSFDDNINPLKVVYSDNYLLNFVGDVYEDEIGAPIAQFHSTNNWNGASYDGESFTFNLSYNSVGRIETRDIIINLGVEFSTEINERFTYMN